MKKILNTLKEGIKRLRGNFSGKKDDASDSEEVTEKKLTYKQAKAKRIRKRAAAHRKYASIERKRTSGPKLTRKFRVRNLRRFLPRVKIKDSNLKIPCVCFILNHEDRGLKAKGIRSGFISTGASAKKRQQRAMRRGHVVEAFQWPDKGLACRADMDRQLTLGGK